MGRIAYDFSGEHVLVTGASRGIGRAVAEGFAAAGAEVTILSSGRGIHEAAREMSERFGRRIEALECDITDSAAVKATLAPLGPIDVLVNNAGLERITPVTDEDDGVEDKFRRITDINTNGTFYVTRHALPHMREGGRIVVTASIWSRVAVPEFSAYIASKHANLGFTRVMAKELGGRCIRVNAVCPGWVRTEAAMLSLKNMSLRTGRSEEDLLDEIVGAQVLPGLLEPEDLAAPYLFLASDGARDMTGQALMLDRGEVMA
ncbi:MULTISPECIES: SDR family NAD(P)-dependent oxidoreductase [unclassified Ensifer]|uniref:SDR family NAD(P)-dependent oxidoreductase n=1 Tax=unclassified Ensifer TaxID=2633371 RepID=UPI0007123F82|nr:MULTISPECIES: SDR family NAD(P)-dependent oxidoreductase [unclassified Ensifer]KQX49697.1 3-beta hydroxysteroid dehydrogenase [Ensifer sp. Root1298]KQX78434.1 3-beta hydroxysteroid dehydrogenase [Ensifer sp. Root1312]KRC17908.1 3-beta hydroxysteroid dehydrogenase [Ensifer sp. Root74]KRD78149.1 3-beta hydroxysteroid dehydrogenase [Ensifer sp. Root954]